MVEAVLADFATCDCSVVTTWDERLGPPPAMADEVLPAADPDQERELFSRLAAECDGTFLIAPESGGVLARRRRLVDELGGRPLGCSGEAIELCTDKLALSAFLERHGVATIATTSFQPDALLQAFPFPVVVKPRDGAGCLDTFRVDGADSLCVARAAFSGSESSGRAIVQPFVPGQAFSVAAIVDVDGAQHVLFPPVLQELSVEGRFRYSGGSAPARFDAVTMNRVRTLVDQVCAVLPGLAGYVGFDMILPETLPGTPLIVEINPRLTTSYLGYRALTRENLAERLLGRSCRPADVCWEPRRVRFTPRGTLTIEEHVAQD